MYNLHHIERGSMVFKVHDVIEPTEIASRAEPHLVRTRDGVRLATDVYLPRSGRPAEAILVRTPYDKASRYAGMSRTADFFNEAGYVLVVQDCRGKFRSEGATEPYVHDVVDAYDTVDWIVAQPWSNGVVGLLGPSYLGYTAWAGVATGHPAVRAAIPQATGQDMANMHVGSPWQLSPPNLLGLNDLVQIWTENRSFLLDLDFEQRPVDMVAQARAELGASAGVARLLEAAESGAWINPYGDRHPRFTTAIPILHWVEWFDPALAPLGLADYKGYRRSPGRPDLHYLRVNSADHGGFLLEDVPRRPANDPNVNDVAYDRRIEREAIDEIEFFDAFLRGKDSRWTDAARVRWHHGHGGWNDAPEWPARGIHEERLYLNPSRDPSGGHRLASEGTPTSSTISWAHDPTSPVPSSTNIEQIWTYLEDYPDCRDLVEREDVVAFRTEPLDVALDVAGEVGAVLSLSSTAPSMHVFLRLLDELPDGTLRAVSRGEAVVDQRSYGSRLRVSLLDCAYRWRAGHALVLLVAGSDYPYFLPHPGTAENPWFARNLKPAKHSLIVGRANGCFLSLRTSDRGGFGAADIGSADPS
jgi:uncharacterized protein